MKFTIEKGNVRPSYLDRLWWLIQQNVLTTRRSASWMVKFDRPDKDCHIKLCGLIDITHHIERVKYRGWSRFPALAHEESRRIIAHFHRDHVRLTTYIYHKGKGPVTTPHEFPHEPIGRVKYGEWHEIHIGYNAAWLDRLNVGFSNAIPIPPMPGRIRTFAGAHAMNGPASPHAPCDIEFEMVFGLTKNIT